MVKYNKDDIVKAIHAGLAVSAICSEFGVPRSTVFFIKKKLKVTGTVARKIGSGRPVSKVTRDFTMKLRAKFRATPNKSVRTMAKEFQVDEKTIRNVAKGYGFKSRAKIRKFLLTDRLRASRLERAKKILLILKKKKPVILFSDEKYFTVDQVSNSMFDRFISKKKVSEVPDHIKTVSKTKHPSQIMMFGLVTSDGRKMDPVFLPSGLRMGAKEYIDRVLKTHVLPWVRATYGEENEVVFMQDGAPAHTANIPQKWLEENLDFWPKTIWPPSSPDLNPLDFSIWAKVESMACKKPHTNVKTLKDDIRKAWAKMSKAYIIKTCRSFRPRIEAVIEAEGGHINVN